MFRPWSGDDGRPTAFIPLVESHGHAVGAHQAESADDPAGQRGGDGGPGVAFLERPGAVAGPAQRHGQVGLEEDFGDRQPSAVAGASARVPEEGRVDEEIRGLGHEHEGQGYPDDDRAPPPLVGHEGRQPAAKAVSPSRQHENKSQRGGDGQGQHRPSPEDQTDAESHEPRQEEHHDGREMRDQVVEDEYLAQGDGQVE